ncbi:cytochrome P450 [Nocardia beijingensis]|uniref:cytochrome P450 n=1 Tax=Nocardia beijingensis TaxID=95162 RepID=UPI001E5554B2|nr:cytochrome P450 [Nocardia beijingensis]
MLGDAIRLIRDLLRTLVELPAHGDIVPIGIGRWRAFVVCDPELTRQVLVDDRTCDKGGVLAERARELAGNGLVTCSYMDHRRQRRLLQPAFSRDLVSGYAEVVAEQVAAVTESWRHGGVVDALAAMYAISIRVTCASMFATEQPDDRVARVARDLDVFISGVYRRVLFPRPLARIPTPGKRRYDRAVNHLRGLSADIVADAAVAERGTILSVLAEARDKNGSGLSQTELADQVMTFFAAAVDTTAVALAWALHLLADHPDIAERVHREAVTVLRGRAPTTADLPALELTGRVVMETLRLYPPLWFLTRVTTTAIELGGHRIPAGSTIVCSPYLIHRRGDLHPDPERFDPDRHGHRLPRNALLPFGVVARRGIGDSFAMAETTLALAALTTRWRFEAVSGERIRPVPRFVLAPRTLRLHTLARWVPIRGKSLALYPHIHCCEVSGLHRMIWGRGGMSRIPSRPEQQERPQ